MNLVDSCGWLEYFADGPNADFFAPAIENVAELVVPWLVPLGGLQAGATAAGRGQRAPGCGGDETGQGDRSGHRSGTQRSQVVGSLEPSDGR